MPHVQTYMFWYQPDQICSGKPLLLGAWWAHHIHLRSFCMSGKRTKRQPRAGASCGPLPGHCPTAQAMARQAEMTGRLASQAKYSPLLTAYVSSNHSRKCYQYWQLWTHLQESLIRLLGSANEKMKPTGRVHRLPQLAGINRGKCSGRHSILQAEGLTAKHHLFCPPWVEVRWPLTLSRGFVLFSKKEFQNRF